VLGVPTVSVSNWVAEALTTFVHDPRSTGLGVGLPCASELDCGNTSVGSEKYCTQEKRSFVNATPDLTRREAFTRTNEGTSPPPGDAKMGRPAAGLRRYCRPTAAPGSPRAAAEARSAGAS
jgi:hypothetical protein